MPILYIYTEAITARGRLKQICKSLFRSGVRGPDSVVKSLVTGLTELGVEYDVNRWPKPGQEAVACVLNGKQALRLVLTRKQKFSRIVAGPNIVVSPKEDDGLIADEAISKILVPSRWVKEFYLSIDSALEDRIVVWPAGVEMPQLQTNPKTVDFLIYDKLPQTEYASRIEKFLKEKGFRIHKLRYGSVSQSQYFALLNESRYLVYVSASESQGLGLFEAWARNVPTLCFERGEYIYGDKKWVGKVGAPYLAPENGLSFATFEEFCGQVQDLPQIHFEPRQFVLDHFTNKAAAQVLLQIALP